MFSLGSYATIWGCEDKGNYSLVEMSTSRKDKKTEKYKTDFSSKYVRFVGKAHDKAKKDNLGRKDRIKIGNCGVTVELGQDGRWYTNFIVFEFDSAEGHNSSNHKEEYDGDYDEDDELPV